MGCALDGREGVKRCRIDKIGGTGRSKGFDLNAEELKEG